MCVRTGLDTQKELFPKIVRDLVPVLKVNYEYLRKMNISPLSTGTESDLKMSIEILNF